MKEKVLLIASEATPFAKTGGLGDVVGSLPKQLHKQGLDVRVILPKYSSIPQEFSSQMHLKATITVPVGWRQQYCGIFEYVYEGVPFYFIDNEYYFARPGIYGYYDEAERYAFFSQAVLAALPAIEFYPDVLHLNDWQTGMIPFLLQQQYPQYKEMKTLFTIHNLAYQGVFPQDIMGNLFGVDDYGATVQGIEFYGQVNFMKAGITYADFVNTVSTTYAAEICTEYFGEKLDGALRDRGQRLSGIVNGIDYEQYNPMKDEYIAAHYHCRALRKRKENKVHLQQLLGLSAAADKPILGIVSRLVESKGFDLIQAILTDLLAQDVQLVILGTGEQQYEELFQQLAKRYPEQVATQITFNEELAHKIYAGSDIFLMPSKFEPCGIGQLIAMRYGAIPIVRATGGLKDTVVPYNGTTRVGSGFTFEQYNAHELLATVRQAIAVYQDSKQWAEMIHQAMKADYSWKEAAKAYGVLYAQLVEERNV